MEENIPLSGPIDLDALGEYLMSYHARDRQHGIVRPQLGSSLSTRPRI
jgi:hypothetical protein